MVYFFPTQSSNKKVIHIIQQMAQMQEQLGRSRTRLIRALCLPLFFFALIPRSLPHPSHRVHPASPFSLQNIILYFSNALLQQHTVQKSYRISKRFQLNRKPGARVFLLAGMLHFSVTLRETALLLYSQLLKLKVPVNTL